MNYGILGKTLSVINQYGIHLTTSRKVNAGRAVIRIAMVPAISLYAVLLCASHISGQNYPDNRGVEFIVGYMANYKLESSPELFVTTSKTSIVTVSVTAPMFPEAALDEKFTVTEGQVHQVFINNCIRAVGTAKETKGIVVTASDEVVVYGTNVEEYSNDAFLGFPVDVLGNDYYTVSHHPSTMECEFLLVGVYDSTNVTITFGTHPDIDVVYEGVHYYSGDKLEINLNRLDTFQVQTLGDLTATHIDSDRDVVVYSGNMFTSVNGTSRDHLVDQMLPVHTWGRLFVTVPIPYRLVIKPGDEVKFIASENDTFVNVTCSAGYSVTFSLDEGNYAQYILPSDECCAINATHPIMVILIVLSQFSNKEPADPALITIPPSEQYTYEYTLATPKYSQGIYRNFAMFVVNAELKNGLLIDGGPVPSGTTYTAVPGTDFVAGFFEVDDGTHNFKHTEESVFGLFMYGTAKWETYGMPGGLSLAHINGWCDLSFTPVDGDGIDNDCDDLIDEEDCSPENNGTDDDGDGLIDEDCALPPPIDGNWTEWGSWSPCSIPCVEYDDNTTVGVKTRNRSCSVPTPEYGGYMCVGESEENSTCPDTICPVHGNWSSWNQWSSCSVTCSNGTVTRSRSCDNPAPQYGGDNCTGDENETDTCFAGIYCPIDGGFSEWSSWDSCTVTCGGGTQNRSRTCTNPEPLYLGAPCVGDTGEQRSCYTQSCPGSLTLDGSWGPWSNWSSCSQSCGTGHMARFRICDNPAPTPDGNPCYGEAVRQKDCNTQTCVGPVIWSANGTYVSKCPERFFSCKAGGITCVEQHFRCDCVPDCDDGSDESSDWATCSSRLYTYCERNGSSGKNRVITSTFIIWLTCILWTRVT